MGYGSTLYGIKRGFLIIGFTGYTSSGCTTVKNFITRGKPKVPERFDGKHISEIYKYKNIIREWKNIEWKDFTDVEVAHIILMFAIHQSIRHVYKDENMKKIRSLCIAERESFIGTKYLFSKSKEINKIQNAERLVLAYRKTKEYFRKLKTLLADGNIYNYVKILQNYGDEIRKYGRISPAGNETHSPENILVFPEAIRKIIKAFRVAENKTYFTIDAFRNPFEVEYFKRRYEEFYLVCVMRSENERREKLIKKGLNDKQYNELFSREQCKKKGKEIHQWITSQNIPECAQKSSYYINYTSKNKSLLEIIRLICLIQHPGSFQPTDDEFHMQLAMSARQKSGCISRKVGAVVAGSDGGILGIGWNQPPEGQEACLNRTTYELLESEEGSKFSDFELSEEFKQHIHDEYSQKNLNIPFCFKDELKKLEQKKDSTAQKRAEFTRSLHAEERAFLSIKEHSHHIKNSILYSTDSPCTLCAKKAYHLGVSKIVYIEEYPGITNSQTLRSGVRKNEISIEPFEGAAGEAYYKLFSSILPEKDHLEIIIHES